MDFCPLHLLFYTTISIDEYEERLYLDLLKVKNNFCINKY